MAQYIVRDRARLAAMDGISIFGDDAIQPVQSRCIGLSGHHQIPMLQVSSDRVSVGNSIM